ncbi:type IV toxin-antitoxin system AbiEi family antitoxin [Legionella sp. W05-934-2]|uniref:type IV toxin-antitoxin system AbiEi family antitoxin domain-containing protein n=1 Tax=Legionella sp. W05-934-2 TaxID=1198649 RepID=UPI00346291F8
MKTKYSKAVALGGLGKLERTSVSKLWRGTKTIVTPEQAAKIWELTPAQAAKRLAWLNKKGWLERIRQGVYIMVPLESLTSDIVAEEPFAIASEVFDPCYIGGVNAANYWDLTEQLFRTITVMTEKNVQNRKPALAGTEYVLHTLKTEYFYGLKSIWLAGVKVKISDPTRTLVDMLMFPDFCGGLSFIVDVLGNYFKSDMKNIDQFMEYLKAAPNGAALKRLGFILELKYPEEQELIDYCQKNLTNGYAKLNPAQTCEKLVTKWRVWVPQSWKEKAV